MNGVMASTMRRDEAMAFITIGQQIERADITGRILAVRADSAAPTRGRDPYDEVHWMALLRSLAAYQPFRRAIPARPDNGATLRFLLQDDAFPRAVSSCLSELRATVKRLPANEEVLAACTDASVLVADAPIDRLTPGELRKLLGEFALMLGVIHDRLDATYFRSVTALDSESARSREPSIRVAGPVPEQPTPDAAASSGSRVYRVIHRTTYEYGGPVEQSYNEAHLRPRATPYQRCESHTMDIEPEPISRSEYVDAFGNAVSIFVVGGGFERLSVTATSEVTVHCAPPPPPSLPWESAQWLLDIDRQAGARHARQYRAASRLVPSSPVLAEYAHPSFVAGRPLVDAVVDLARRIHEDFVYEPGFTSVTTPVLDVLEFRRGVCQDFAHLAVGCVRSMGLAARYVSGYIETFAPEGQARLLGADASHAWFSVYIPGSGWIDVDPTNNQLVSDSYVTTAWGRDYWDVSPLRGSVEGGGSSHTLEVSVDVTRVTDSPAP
jgi:transglutaminase-like putative cysteine protease